MLSGNYKVPRGIPSEAADALALAIKAFESLPLSPHYREASRVRDQLAGGAAALSQLYHAPIPGLDAKARAYHERSRTHVNLCRPALDRLVNSIHSGSIRRRAADPIVDAMLNRPAYAEDLVSLCEAAFAYGTAVAIPLITKSRVRVWIPDPFSTIIIPQAEDPSVPALIVEFCGDGRMRAVAADFELNGNLFIEQSRGFCPAVVAVGSRQRGTPYGCSLIGPAADASIRITENQANLSILRDQMARSLLVVRGPVVGDGDGAGADADGQGGADGASQDMPVVEMKESAGTLEFVSPESKIEDILKLTERYATDAAVALGLPIDVFRPEVVEGSDASATAARQRAFPLAQKAERLCRQWSIFESQLALVVAGLVEHARTGAPVDLDELETRAGISITVRPEVADSAAESVATEISKLTNFLTPIERVLDEVSEGLSEEQRAELAAAWRKRNMPSAGGARELFAYHLDAGIITLNEARKSIGLPPMPGGDVLLSAATAKAEAIATEQATT